MQELDDGSIVRNKDYWRLKGPGHTGPYENLEGTLDNLPASLQDIIERLEPLVDSQPNLTVSVIHFGQMPDVDYRNLIQRDGGPNELQEVDGQFHSLSLRLGEDHDSWHITTNPWDSIESWKVRAALNIREESLNSCDSSGIENGKRYALSELKL